MNVKTIDTGDVVNILTYDVMHKKTYDTVCLLKAYGYSNVKLWAKPFHYEKKFYPLIEHRPSTLFILGSSGIFDVQSVYKNFGYEFNIINDYDEITEGDGSVYLLCGAGIIPQKFIKKNKIINSHPGYIPKVRGLDALKWAIYEGMPIGVTTHFLGDEVDAGEIIERKIVPVYYNDTFHSVAYRQYDMEISMLVNSLTHLTEHHVFESGNGEVHRRMLHSYETRLLERFDNLRKSVSIEQ